MLHQVLAGALIAATLAAGWQTLRLAREQAAHSETRRDYAEAAQAAVEQVRAEEHRRHRALQETIANAERDAETARADARRARAAGDRLRDAARSVATVACPDRAAAAEPGPPADTAADLLAFVLERVDERAGELARVADEARVAGLACEAAYDALTAR